MNGLAMFYLGGIWISTIIEAIVLIQILEEIKEIKKK